MHEYSYRRQHIHYFEGETTVDRDHDHEFKGYTSRAIPGPHGHVHYYEVYTSVDFDHKHMICGYTGPAMEVPGGHIHSLAGLTTFCSRGHDHRYGNRTGLQEY